MRTNEFFLDFLHLMRFFKGQRKEVKDLETAPAMDATSVQVVTTNGVPAVKHGRHRRGTVAFFIHTFCV